MDRRKLQTWTDANYNAKLKSDPHAALAEAGVKVPTGTTVNVLENTADTRHLVLPIAPNNAGELSIEDLEKVAGGGIRIGEQTRGSTTDKPKARFDSVTSDCQSRTGKAL